MMMEEEEEEKAEEEEIAGRGPTIASPRPW